MVKKVFLFHVKIAKIFNIRIEELQRDMVMAVYNVLT